MPNRNLPYTRFRSYEGRSPVPRVARAEFEAEPPADLPLTPSEGRILRTRRLPAAEADHQWRAWHDAGARELEAPPGWRALQRLRPDALTGMPRLQRMAVGPGDPATVLNWSALEPVDREDEALWRHVLGHAHAAGPDAAPPGAPGWAA